jgi:hypothetical protein
MAMGLRTTAVAAAALLLSSVVTAHDHHTDKIEEGHAVSADPIDSILWIHILIQSMAWGIIFPTGMVLGVSMTTSATPEDNPAHAFR